MTAAESPRPKRLAPAPPAPPASVAGAVAAAVAVVAAAVAGAVLFASAAGAQAADVLTAARLTCQPLAYRQCREWYAACETKPVSEAERAERMVFDLAARRLDFHHAKGVWRFGVVVADAVEASVRRITIARRPEERRRVLVFRVHPSGAMTGSGDEDRFGLTGTCTAP